MLNNLLLRKVKDSDFKNIAKLFKLIFKKKISKKFYNWRYFNKTYTSFIALHKNRIVAHVGFTHYKLDNSSNKIFSRHSTFVVPEFQYVISEIGKDPDQRNYIVSNEKIESTGFKTKVSLIEGIKELKKAFQIIRRNQYSNI